MINVFDEAWRALSILGVGEWLQDAFKQSRRDGVQNIVVMHRLSDLTAAGAAGSREVALAEGLLHDAQTRVIYRQVADKVPRARELLGLTSVEAELLPELDPGVALWKVGSRSFLVQHRLSAIEARSSTPTAGCSIGRATDAATTAPRATRIRSRSRCALRRSARCSRSALCSCCGAASPALLFGERLGERLGSPTCPTCSSRLPEHLGDPRARVAAPTRDAAARRRRASTSRSRCVARGAVAGRGVAAAASACGALATRPRARAGRERSICAAARPRPGTRAHHARPPRPAARRRRARQSVLVDRADPDRQDDRPRDPGDPRVGGPGDRARASRPISSATRIAHRAAARATCSLRPAGEHRPRDTSSWTPLARLPRLGGRPTQRQRGSPRARRRASAALADGDFWYSAAAKLLAPLLFAAATSGLHDGRRRRLARHAGRSRRCSTRSRRPADAEALNAMQANWSRDERQRSSVYTTAETVLEAYADPGVLARSRRAEIRADWLLDGGRNTLYLSATAREQRRLRPVFVALLQEVLEAAYARAGRARAVRSTRRCLLVLDEAANIAPLPDLDVIASTGAGHGVQLLTVLQDLAQAHDRWGRERADTIVNNHRAKLIGAGLADERTLEWVARLLGDRGDRTSARRPRARRAGGRPPNSSGYRPLAPAERRARGARRDGAARLRQPAARRGFALRPWFADRRLPRARRWRDQPYPGQLSTVRLGSGRRVGRRAARTSVEAPPAAPVEGRSASSIAAARRAATPTREAPRAAAFVARARVELRRGRAASRSSPTSSRADARGRSSSSRGDRGRLDAEADPSTVDRARPAQSVVGAARESRPPARAAPLLAQAHDRALETRPRTGR